MYIALINVAFDDAKDIWKLVWMENKLRYIERAESITYNIPGKVDMVDRFRVFLAIFKAQEAFGC